MKRILCAALALSVCCAAMLQRLAGQGLGMVSAPVMALLAPGHLPATLLPARHHTQYARLATARKVKGWSR